MNNSVYQTNRHRKSYRNQSTFIDSQSQDNCSSYLNSINVDYRTKTFDLMKKNASLSLLLRQSEKNVLYLEKSIEEMKTQMDQIFQVFGISIQDFSDPKIFDKAVDDMKCLLKNVFKEKCESEQKSINSSKQSNLNINISMPDTSKNSLLDCDCAKQFDTIIEEYKLIIENQHRNFKKKQKSMKKIEKQLESLRCDNQKIMEQSKILAQNDEKLKQEIKNLKKQYENLKIRTDLKIAELQDEISYKDQQIGQINMNNEQILKEKEAALEKYRTQIYHFEQMEAIVEQKLIQVEEQMSYYKTQRLEQVKTIKQLKSKLGSKEEEEYYSFGEKQKCVQTQTEQQYQAEKEEKRESIDKQSNNCYEESIKTLLMENQRLKNALYNLNKKQKQQTLDHQTQLQLKLILATIG